MRSSARQWAWAACGVRSHFTAYPGAAADRLRRPLSRVVRRGRHRSMSSSGGLRIPRWTALITWPAMFLLAHAAAPAGLSELTPHYGWVEGRPSVWNLPSLVLVVSSES